jgi:hypothetical protein
MYVPGAGAIGVVVLLTGCAGSAASQTAFAPAQTLVRSQRYTPHIRSWMRPEANRSGPRDVVEKKVKSRRKVATRAGESVVAGPSRDGSQPSGRGVKAMADDALRGDTGASYEAIVAQNRGRHRTPTQLGLRAAWRALKSVKASDSFQK